MKKGETWIVQGRDTLGQTLNRSKIYSISLTSDKECLLCLVPLLPNTFIISVFKSKTKHFFSHNRIKKAGIWLIIPHFWHTF